jgi:hypothetical protein
MNSHQPQISLLTLAQFRNDLVDATLAIALQAKRKIAVIRLVTAARPNWRPVRREVLSTSGVAARIFSTPRRTSLVSTKDDPAGIR